MLLAASYADGRTPAPRRILTHLSLLNLNWYVQSLATPVRFTLRLPPQPPKPLPELAHADAQPTPNLQQSRGRAVLKQGLAERLRAPREGSEPAASGAGGQGGRVLQGQGFAHLEKNWACVPPALASGCRPSRWLTGAPTSASPR